MEDRHLTEKESLELITRMIKETQENTARYAAYPLLIWGYITLLISITIWFVLSRNSTYYAIHFLWFALPAIAYPLTLYFNKKDERRMGTRNYIDRITGYIWMVLGFAGFGVSAASFFNLLNVFFVIPLLMSIGVTLTGSVSRFKPMIVLGGIGMALSFLTLFIPGVDRILIFAAIFAVMMVIPGHLFNRQLKKQCLKN